MNRSAYASLLLIAGCGQTQDQPQPARADNPVSSERASLPPQWAYWTDLDEMRGSRTWSASLDSVNAARLTPPYEGGSPTTILLTQDEGEDPFNQSPRLILRNGQFDCERYCNLAVKFDDGPVMSMTSARKDCGSRECVFLNIDQDVDLWAQRKPAPGFAKRLLDAERVIVEVPLYKYGAHQYRFETKGLVWPRPGAPLQASRPAAPELDVPETIVVPEVDVPTGVTAVTGE